MKDNFIRYVIFLSTVNPDKISEKLVRSHVEHMKEIEQASKLEMCGPFSDGLGGMVIIKASSIDEAKMIAEKDPFVQEGYSSYEVKKWELSCSENNHMGMG